MEPTRAASATPVRSASLVGRIQERADLNCVVERAIHYETPQSVLLVGNQGVGKSRLLDSWTTEAQNRHPELRIYRSRAVQPGTRYGLFSCLLESRFGLKGVENPQEHFRAQVEEVLLDRRLTEVLHFLGGFLGITVRENPFLKALEDAPAQHDQIARTVLRRFLEMDAGRTPLMLILEDLHRADDASLSLFRELTEMLAGAPVMLVGSCRPELFVEHPQLGRLQGDHTRIDLSPLEPEESQELLRELLARAEELPESLLESAVEMTGGNPFFMEELVRLLIDNGSIRIEGERWSVDAARVEQVELPMTVEEAVHARIAALNVAERDVLEKASVLGGVFWLEALVCFSRLEQEVREKTNVWMADVLYQSLKELLNGLIERDYLMALPDSSIPGSTEYAFKHNLERELIGKMLDPARKQQYHRFAAQWLEIRIPDRSETQLEYLGQHHEAGGNTRRAAFCFVHAGDLARARYANEQAAAFYKRGIGLLDLHDAISRIDALHNMGDVCFILGRTGEALEYFSEMLRYAWLLDHRGKGGAAHRRIGRVCTTLGDYDRALEHLKMGLRLFELANDQRGLAATLDDIGLMSSLRGEYEQALGYHRQALAIKRQIGDPRAIAVSLNNIGTVHQNSGSFKAALECFVEALEMRKQVQDRLGIVDSLVNLGSVYRAQADYSKAFQLWADALKLAREIGDRLHEGYLHISLGEAQLQLGRLKEAEAHLSDAAAIALDLGDRRLRADCSRVMCEVKLAQGDNEAAEQHAQVAYQIAEQLGLKPEMGTALRARAAVIAAQPPDPERRARVGEFLAGAVAVFSELGNELELARTFAAFADYHDRCGAWQEADSFRQRADEIFNRLKNARKAAATTPGNN